MVSLSMYYTQVYVGGVFHQVCACAYVQYFIILRSSPMSHIYCKTVGGSLLDCCKLGNASFAEYITYYPQNRTCQLMSEYESFRWVCLHQCARRVDCHE